LVLSVIDLFCTPLLPLELKENFKSADSPGLIASFGQTGIVQPQDAFALVINKSTFPTFVIL